MKLVNVTEMLVRRTLKDYLNKSSEFCQCDRCQLDVVALALNNLPAKYVVTQKGEVLTRADMLAQQHQTDILSEVVKAVEIVNKNPKHE